MRWCLAIVLASGCSFDGTPAPTVGGDAGGDAPGPELDAPLVPGEAMPDAAPQPFKLRIETVIDGESHLIIKGNQLHWKHFIHAAPGRWDADSAAPWTMDPIKLNGVDWLPTWPDLPNPENRVCSMYPCAGVESSTTTLPIAIPNVPCTASWTGVTVRRAQGIIQQPHAGNDYELIVLISDYGVGGATNYVVDVDVAID